jgi:hypothetical protein
MLAVLAESRCRGVSWSAVVGWQISRVIRQGRAAKKEKSWVWLHVY